MYKTPQTLRLEQLSHKLFCHFSFRKETIDDLNFFVTLLNLNLFRIALVSFFIYLKIVYLKVKKTLQ